MADFSRAERLFDWFRDGVPLFVMTHRVAETVPAGQPRYTFITDGVEEAVLQARRAAQRKDVNLMGTTIVQQCRRAGLLDELTISLVPLGCQLCLDAALA